MRAFVEAFLAELEKLYCPTDRETVHHEVIDSTSTDLKRRLDAGSPAGTVVAAVRQTAGRGRSGRAWHSPPGGNLYVSLAVDLGVSAIEAIPITPLAAGVAAWDAISTAGPVELLLKWPNDVLVKGKKLAGVLCEVSGPIRAGIAVVGFGLNIATREFPKELSDKAVSLLLVTDREMPYPENQAALVAARWVAGLEGLMKKVRAGNFSEVIQAWRERAEPFGRRVRVGDIEGVTVDLGADGRLIVMTDDGEHVPVAGGIVESV